ncbi:MAG TPA: GNAT family N-acetyltransferase [Bryobacteraceae bacterium]|jgi:GNAT superfamily N-acetyltransferase
MAGLAMPSEVTVRQLRESEIPAADRIFRLSFGTFLGLPDPMQFSGDADYIGSRWRAHPQGAFAAEAGGEIAGSNFATRWGSVAFFGPLTIRPNLWDKGIGKRLLDPVMDRFAEWGVVHAGLFTFAHSPKHVHLYQKYGFWPRFLTAILSKPATQDLKSQEGVRYSDLRADQRQEALGASRDVADSIFAGLDPTPEIVSVASQGLGETILLYDSSRLAGFAVCHCGPGSEAGSGICYIKFAAVRSGGGARSRFERLVGACGALAVQRDLRRVVAGMNLARSEAFQALAGLGFRVDFQGIAMERPNEPGYNRPDVYAIDDWR